MRIFNDFKECYSEVGRDLVEMGTIHPSASYQNVGVAGDDNYDMKEIIGYPFRVAGWRGWRNYFSPEEETWIENELRERMYVGLLNPGHAFNHRYNVWNRFLNTNGEFDYTYNERIRTQLPGVIKEMKKNPNTRQAIITIYDRGDQKGFGGRFRIPCSMHYQFLSRGDNLEVIYSMRSCDYFTHFKFDVMLAIRLGQVVGVKIHKPFRALTMFIGSLHCFRKNWEEAKIF